MRIDATHSETYRPARIVVRGRVEKCSKQQGSSGYTSTGHYAKQEILHPQPGKTSSRFGTVENQSNSLSGTPAGFIAQVIGQVLGSTDAYAPHAMAAYARANAGANQPQAVRFA